MKKLVGIIAALAISTIAVCGALAIWGIYPISWMVILKASITLAILFAVVALLWLIATLFFKKEKYDKESGNKAHPIN